ncbi:MAG: homocysteine S-methyltransferase family protein [Pseudomonadota bacterium]
MGAKYRHALPQLSGNIFLTDADIETDLIFNHGVEIPKFAAHTLLSDENGRQAVQRYLRGFLSLARDRGTGFILDSQTWKAHPHWAAHLGAAAEDLRPVNHDAIALISGLREEFANNAAPIVLNGVIGPRGDAYAPEELISPDESQRYHAQQIGWLAETDVDMVTALTFTQSGEAIGVVRAAQGAGLPVVISFTVETDGRLPSGQPLSEAVEAVDQATRNGPAYYMVNCAHPDHFAGDLTDSSWGRRIRGLRCNASRMSHAELEACEMLDDGNPRELATQYRAIRMALPWMNVFGGCCGSGLRHVTQIATALAA